MSTKDKPIKSDLTDRSSKHGASDTQDFGVNLADPSTRNILGTMSARPGTRVENDALSFDTEGSSTSLTDKWQKFLRTSQHDGSSNPTTAEMAGLTRAPETPGDNLPKVPYTTPGAGDLTRPPQMPGPSDAPMPEREPTHSGGKILTGTDGGAEVKSKPTKEGPVIISEYEPPYQDPRKANKLKDELIAGDGQAETKNPKQQNGLTPTSEDRKFAQADLENSRDLFSNMFSDKQNEQIANIQNSLVNGNFEAFTAALHDAGQSANGRRDALGGAQLGLDNGNAEINLRKDGENVLAYSDTGNYALQVNKDGTTSVRRITRDAEGNVTVQPGEISPDEKTAESVFNGLSNHAVKKLSENRQHTEGGALTAAKENQFEDATQQKPLPKKEPVIIEENPMPKPVPPPPKVPRNSDGTIQAPPPRDDSRQKPSHSDQDKLGTLGQVGDQGPGPKPSPDINRVMPTEKERIQASALLLNAGMKNHDGLTSDQSSKAHDIAQALVDGKLDKVTDALRAAAQDANSDAIFSAIEKDLKSVGSDLSIQRIGDTVRLSDQSGKNAVSINLATGAAAALDSVQLADGQMAFVGPISQSADAALRGLSMNLVTDAGSHHQKSILKPKLFDGFLSHGAEGPKPVHKDPHPRHYLEAISIDSY